MCCNGFTCSIDSLAPNSNYVYQQFVVPKILFFLILRWHCVHIVADILDKCTSRTIIPREKLFQITCEGKMAKQINTQPQWSSRNMQCPLCEYDMKKGTKYRRVKKKERHRKKKHSRMTTKKKKRQQQRPKPTARLHFILQRTTNKIRTYICKSWSQYARLNPLILMRLYISTEPNFEWMWWCARIFL